MKSNLELAFELQDEAVKQFQKVKACGNFTDRSDPHLHAYQDMTHRAVVLSGMSETPFYFAYNESRSQIRD